MKGYAMIVVVTATNVQNAWDHLSARLARDPNVQFVGQGWPVKPNTTGDYDTRTCVGQRP